jgi:hypothetical protein
MLLSNLGVEARFYDCIEENGWEADLDMLRSLVDEKTRAIVVVSQSSSGNGIISTDILRQTLVIHAEPTSLLDTFQIF